MAARNIQYYYFDPVFNAFYPHPNDLSLATYDAVAARNVYLDGEGFRHSYPIVGNSYVLSDDTFEYTLVDLPSDIQAMNYMRTMNDKPGPQRQPERKQQ